jgi:hypothetical protein
MNTIWPTFQGRGALADFSVGARDARTCIPQLASVAVPTDIHLLGHAAPFPIGLTALELANAFWGAKQWKLEGPDGDPATADITDLLPDQFADRRESMITLFAYSLEMSGSHFFLALNLPEMASDGGDPPLFYPSIVCSVDGGTLGNFYSGAVGGTGSPVARFHFLGHSVPINGTGSCADVKLTISERWS